MAASSRTPAPPPGPTPEAPGPTLHQEIETKLEIDAAAALPDPLADSRVRAAGLVAADEPVTHSLDATYFDTDRLDLVRSKVTLRRRSGGDDAGWHLKLPAADTVRTEVRLPLTDDDQVPAQLAGIVLGTARGRELRPVARLQNTRTVRRLLDADGRPAVEIADDAVTATPPAHPDRADSWRELEVEVLDGTSDQFSATVAALLSAGARRSPHRSKLARALELSGASATTAAAAPNHSPGGITDTVLETLADQRDRLIAADRALRHRAPEALHDGRASARRIRSVLGVFSRLFDPDAAASLRERLREYGRVLSAARDLQVAGHRITAALADEPEEYALPAGAVISTAIGTRSAAAADRVAEFLTGDDYLGLLRDLDELLDMPAPQGRSATSHATDATNLPALDQQWQRLAHRAAVALGDPENPPAWHAVRRAAKASRYAAEAVAATVGEPATRMADRAEQIQETLGEHQDATVTAALLVEMAGDRPVDGRCAFLLGRLHAMEQAAAAGAAEEFAALWDRIGDAGVAR